MIEYLNKIDIQLFLFLNGMHNDFLDFVMYWLSNKFIWIPLYLFLLYLIFKNNKKFFIVIFSFIILLIFLSDFGSVHLFKELVQRPRPCHALGNLVHTLDGHCGGSYGFVSSHAANTFAIAAYVSLILRPYYNIFKYILFLWAFAVSYSRIYLGVHYPGDVLCGGIYGIIVGLFVFWLFKKTNIFFKKKSY